VIERAERATEDSISEWPVQFHQSPLSTGKFHLLESALCEVGSFPLYPSLILLLWSRKHGIPITKTLDNFFVTDRRRFTRMLERSVHAAGVKVCPKHN